jgi:hypothetical protein
MSIVVMRQHNIWCVGGRGMPWRLFVVLQKHNVWCVCVEFCVGHDSEIPLHKERHTHTHTKRYAATLPQTKSSNFNKEPTSSLKMIWMMIETCWNVFKCFNIDILD